MKRNIIETVLGGVVLLVAGLFLVFAYLGSDVRSVEGYNVTAKFDAIDGLSLGSDVRIGGVKIGSVVDQKVDTEDFQAVVTLVILPEVKLPEDTKASITSSGLLGTKYVKLEPGGADAKIIGGGRIQHTKSVVSLEEMLGKVIFLVTE
jgi:ABC-type transport system involved in resistance to organic solvents, periplasmic component